MSQSSGVSTRPFGVVPPGTPPPPGARRLHVLLVKPSKYDDDGYVIRFVRGVLPSNTLATLRALTGEVAARGELGDVEVVVHLLDEIVDRIDPVRLVRRWTRRRGDRLVVALAGVQSNQFPRAADLAREFRAAGAPVMIGGFHVSGSLAMDPRGVPPELREMLDAGVTLVRGEVEECWGDLLRDALHGKLRPLYEVPSPPDISRAEIPVVDPRLMKRFAYPDMGTIDAGRGCPFNCSFCTIINVQGRKMRWRRADRIVERIRANHELGIDYYFFTDDNFARNPEWEGVFDGLIALREEGLPVEFMMQVDTQAWRIPRFVEKASRAGCTQVFVGMESLNPDNLAAAGKRQNDVRGYREMVEAWHAHDIAVHVGYIIGFPYDTPESVRREVRQLRDEVGVDQASFFMLTPIPGSADHREMLLRGEPIDEDLNRYDSFQPAMDHPRMTREEWLAAYRDAWREFYSVEGMIRILSRVPTRDYWGIFKNFLWYRYAVDVEDTHPMICGFLRIRDRRQRRPGFAVEGRLAHARRRARELARNARALVRLYRDMQEVWLATRGRPALEEQVRAWRERYEELHRRADEAWARAGETRRAAAERMRERAEAVRARAEEAAARLAAMRERAVSGVSVRLGGLREDGLRRAGWLRRQWERLVHPFRIRVVSRAELDATWRATWDALRRGRVWGLRPLRVLVTAARDAKLAVAFSRDVLRAR